MKVTVEQLTVAPHPNADRLELAQVGLYRAVVPKGEYQTGGYALYIPEGALIPDELIEELGLTGKLAGKAKNRVKAVRLRGEVSQGVVCRPKAAGPWDDSTTNMMTAAAGNDFAEQLGIVKWVPEIPAHMSGEVVGAPELIRWIEIENLKRYPDIFTPGEPVVATEKIHGTACLVTLDVDSDTLLVSSKGHGSKNFALVESDTNLYWRAAAAYQLKERLAGIVKDGEDQIARIAVFGEVFGKGVQDLAYGANAGSNETLGYRAFDVKIIYRVGTTFGEDRWMAADGFQEFCDRYQLPAVPVLYDGPFDLEKLTAVASGITTVGGDNIREGVVIRPAKEAYSETLGGRKIAKLVSDNYLLRKDGTEFE